MTTIVDIDDANRITDAIYQALVDADYTEPLHEIADYLREIHAGFFASETSPTGAPWTPWYFRRLGADPNHRTLDDTGRLRESLQGGPDHIENIHSRDLEFGTSVPYAYQHQIGGEFTVGQFLVGRNGGARHVGQTINLPKREFLGINPTHLEQIGETVARSAARQMIDAIDGSL